MKERIVCVAIALCTVNSPFYTLLNIIFYSRFDCTSFSFLRSVSILFSRLIVVVKMNVYITIYSLQLTYPKLSGCGSSDVLCI